MIKRHRSRNMLFNIGLALIGLLGVALGVRPVAWATDDAPISPLAAPAPAAITAASLHNPGFDNHDWYFFGVDRYDPSYPSGPGGSGKPLLPDDDNNTGNTIPESELQDWRLWYMRDYPLVQTFSEAVVVHSGESVVVRTYDGTNHLGGIYQMIYDTVPCAEYQFTMYALSKPDSGSPAAALQVGIDRVGWHPDPNTDPAVPGAFPSTTVWGAAQDFKYPTFGQVSVTAEALDDQIAAYTYASTTGGRSHAIVWDSGAFQDVTPGSIFDPETDALNPAGISSGPTASTTSTTAQISWQSSSAAISQVFYRLQSTSTTPPPTEPLTHTIYLPFIAAYQPWAATELIKTASASHVVDLAGLTPNSTYEYIVVSRGVSGEQCVTWSKQATFSTQP